ncbi:hypothetical protein BH11VER1_BH11VER1_25600 [soil metagenome]
MNVNYREHPVPRLHRGALPAFTLLEIVIAITILAVLSAATIPSFRGMKDEQIAREPLAALSRMAKEARLHAMKEKRPYQIAFTAHSLTATRYFSPYLQAAQLEEFLQKAAVDSEAQELEDEKKREAGVSTTAEGSSEVPAAFHEWTDRYELPEGTTYSVKVWHEVEATPIEGETVKLWVFQPSGLCTPLTVKMERETALFEAGFSALTADIITEKSEMK